MKVLTILIAIIFSLPALAGEIYDINPNFAPATKYEVNGRLSMGMDFKMGTTDADNSDMTSNNSTKGFSAKGDTRMVLETETLQDNDRLPFSLDISDINFELEDTENPYSTNNRNIDSILKANIPTRGYIQNNKIHFEGINEDTPDANAFGGGGINEMFIQGMNLDDMMPHAELAIGQRAEMFDTLPFPLAGENIVFKTIYTLQSVRDSKAFFDVSFHLLENEKEELEIEETPSDSTDGFSAMMTKIFEQLSFDVKIAGVGNAVYDLERDFFTIQNTNAVFDIQMSMEGEESVALSITMDQYITTDIVD